jgi:nucleoside-diphosphate-sugar epimerase
VKLVIGGSGRLGKALCAALGPHNTLAPARAVYENWWQPGMDATIEAFLTRAPQPIDCIFIAAGIIDSRASAADHERVNFRLPEQILRAAARCHIRVVTLGTMMELISCGEPPSAYAASKRALARQVQTLRQDALHIRINTVYGTVPPAPYMFAGLMLKALVTHSPFLMSPGNQMREYHHIDDEVQAIIALAASAQAGVINLNHGAPITMAALAHRTFEALDALDLLRIGALPAPTNERFDLEYVRPFLLNGLNFRDALTAMPSYMRECVSAS